MIGKWSGVFMWARMFEEVMAGNRCIVAKDKSMRVALLCSWFGGLVKMMEVGLWCLNVSAQICCCSS